MARAFSVFANGGYLVQPYFIRQIKDASGKVVFEAKPERTCPDCPPPNLPQVASPQSTYLITSMLHDVIQRGTGVKAKSLGREDLAGKTGTTNDMKDAWFSGYNADLVTTCWIGFDQLQPLGDKETGGHAALPMWMYFMGEALKDKPESSVPRPDGLVTVRINPATGQLASSTNADAIFETFQEDRIPGAGADSGQSYGATGGGRVDELF
jgi:penicillin-binding protein 1A